MMQFSLNKFLIQLN